MKRSSIRSTLHKPWLSVFKKKIPSPKPDEPVPRQNESVCNLCLSWFTATGLKNEIEHYNDYGALKESSLSCRCCWVLVESLEHNKLECPHFVGDLKHAKTTTRKTHAVGQVSSHTLWEFTIFCNVAPSLESFIGKLVKVCVAPVSPTKISIWSSATGYIPLEDRMAIVRGWIRTCTDFHQHCRLHATDSPPLPTRVIDVGVPEQNESPRLVLSEGRFGQYTTLSHCWGAIQPLTTTKPTLDERLLEIPTENLPRTFREAVAVTRCLGIRYLWIDSLCIVQDDRNDWEVESARMVDIYRNSFVTLSATAAHDSSGGLNFPVEPSVEINHLPGASAYFRIEDDSRNSEILDSPLSKRAWVLQETLLSRRVIHFGEKKLYWECDQQCLAEDEFQVYLPTRLARSINFMTSLPKGSDFVENSKFEGWWDILQNYNVRKLTKPSDKLAALAGMSAFYEKLVKEPSFIGLWKSNLHSDLLWVIQPFSVDAENSQNSQLPSWSPLSKDGQITHFLAMSSSKLSLNILQVLYTNVTWSNSPMTSHLEGVELVVKSRAIKVQPSDFVKSDEDRNIYYLTTRPDELTGKLWLDSPHHFTEAADDAKFWLLQVREAATVSGGPYWIIYTLLIEPLSKIEGSDDIVYHGKRIGAGQFQLRATQSVPRYNDVEPLWPTFVNVFKDGNAKMLTISLT